MTLCCTTAFAQASAPIDPYADMWNFWKSYIWVGGGWGWGAAQKNSVQSYQYYPFVPQNPNYSLPVTQITDTYAARIYTISTGIKFDKLAVRIKYDDISFGVNNSVDASGIAPVNYTAGIVSSSETALYLQGMYFTPITGQFDFYAALGAGVMDYSVSVFPAMINPNTPVPDPYGGQSIPTNPYVTPPYAKDNSAFMIPISLGVNWNFSDYMVADLDATYLVSCSPTRAPSTLVPTLSINIIY